MNRLNSDSCISAPNQNQQSCHATYDDHVSTLSLPASRYVAVTWGIRPDSGGLTVTLLHRAGILSLAGAGHIDVLTFDTHAHYHQVEQELRSSGRLFGDVSILNMWDWLRTEEIPPRTGAVPESVIAACAPLEPAADVDEHSQDGVLYSRIRYAADNLTVLQADHYRADGTLMVTDRRDVRERGTLGGRRIVLCDNKGTPARMWKYANDFYHWLLDRMFSAEKTTFLIDSKTATGMFTGYRRRNALTVHIIQGAHIEYYSPEGVPVLSHSRAKAIQELPSFDLVATLTNRQRRDVTAIVGASPNLSVIPNSVPLPDPTSVTLERDLHRGIVVAAFIPRKRVHLAVEAAALAHAQKPSLHLDVYGSGIHQEQVEKAVSENFAASYVTLHGYSTTALAETATASFILITSETEGTPLVLLEGMAAGCIPIAFDIPYGPSDVITHGVSGFLIPDGDLEAMAQAIVTLQNMNPEAVLAMRRAAIAAVQGFNDAAVIELWKKELSRAWSRKGALWWRALKRWQHGHAARQYARVNPLIGEKLPPAPKR